MAGLSAKTVAAVEWLARSDPRFAITADQLDSDPWLFNTPAGTVELKTGQLREHRRLDYITKIAGCGPGGDCPLFLDFLDTIFEKDNELIGYLQKLLGYVLTGVTTEHVMAFFHGTGANGKSVLISTIAWILGSYHRVAPIDCFTVTGMPGHPTDMAGLMGARLVTAIETEEGRRWAEAKICALTGGDKITARFMRRDYFDFVPAFKLIIAGNHKPGLRSVGEAMRRRLHLIPFNYTVPVADRDKGLVDKLKAEGPGILAWMIEGCLRWQAEGLEPPPSVIGATDAYMKSEDVVAAWIDDECVLGSGKSAASSVLFASFKNWAEANGEYAGKQRGLIDKLLLRPGIERSPDCHTRGLLGIAVKPVSQGRF
jgi:putative DNA primase/helicase